VRSRNARSEYEAELLELAERLLPTGVRNASVSPEYAMVIKEAHGSRITDCSGNEYIDYLLGSGPMLLGHAHPAVVAAVRDQLERGSSYLMINEPAIRLAVAITELVPCAEAVCFHCSGSEAVFFALRLARAYRRREKILKFEGAYHGMSDYALMSNQWTRVPRDYPSAAPNSAGIPAAIADQVLIAPFNNIGTTSAIIEAHHDELAAVIIEPLQRTIPPQPGFLQGLRTVTHHYGIPLIFDEVVTGFRLALGGAQAYYGVTPDLCALGKAISGGHPLGVLCGRKEILDLANSERAGADVVRLTGTFAANPISAAAALACIKELRVPGCYEQLALKGRRLMHALQQELDDAHIPAQITGEPFAFQPWFTDQPILDHRSTLSANSQLNLQFIDRLLDAGVIKGHEKFFVSMAHTDEDIQLTLDAFAFAVGELKAHGASSVRAPSRQGDV
jgi:glutamate-1-semialdehyde 2,1-aminomutase